MGSPTTRGRASSEPAVDDDGFTYIPEHVSIGINAAPLYGAIGILVGHLCAHARRARACATRSHSPTPPPPWTGFARRRTRRTNDRSPKSPGTPPTTSVRRAPGTAGMREGVRYQIYESSDGHVLFMASEREFWKNFCEGVGRPDLFESHPGSKYADHAIGDTELRRELQTIFRTPDFGRVARVRRRGQHADRSGEHAGDDRRGPAVRRSHELDPARSIGGRATAEPAQDRGRRAAAADHGTDRRRAHRRRAAGRPRLRRRAADRASCARRERWGRAGGRFRDSSRDAADRFGDREAVVDGDLAAVVRRIDRRRRSGGTRRHGRGCHARRPRRDLGSQLLGMDRRGAGGARGGRSSRPDQHAVQGTRGRLHPRARGGQSCCSPCRDSWTSITYSCCATPTSPSAASWSFADRPPIRTMSWNDFLLGADQVAMSELQRRQDSIEPDDLSDIMFTSGTTGKPKGVMTTHGADVARLRGLVARRRPARGRPVPDRQPVLPHLRLQGRIHRVPHARGDDHPARGLRRSRKCSGGSRRSGHHVLPGPPTLYQSILNSPDHGRSVVAAPGRDGSGASSGGAHQSHALGAQLRDDPHRLRPDGIHRHRDDVPSGRRSGDDLEHVGTCHPRRRGAHRRRRARTKCHEGSRGRSSSAVTT